MVRSKRETNEWVICLNKGKSYILQTWEPDHEPFRKTVVVGGNQALKLFSILENCTYRRIRAFCFSKIYRVIIVIGMCFPERSLITKILNVSFLIKITFA